LTFNNQNARIIGGNVANPGSWPASASLIFNYKKNIFLNGATFTTSIGAMCGGKITLL
jgi:hypothetical protein